MALRLIYGCALRVSEAAHLEIRDVDLDDGALMIRATKFNKSRVVPMADGLGRRCRQYADDLLEGKPKDYPFLPSHKGRFYDIGTIYGFFRQALHKAQIPHTGKGPRIHDLRHSAVCRCLANWVRGGKDITNALPYLSAYLGHEDLRGTQHYLRLTAEMYPDILDEMERNSSWMIPEVTGYEAD
jgi:integrase